MLKACVTSVTAVTPISMVICISRIVMRSSAFLLAISSRIRVVAGTSVSAVVSFSGAPVAAYPSTEDLASLHSDTTLLDWSCTITVTRLLEAISFMTIPIPSNLESSVQLLQPRESRHMFGFRPSAFLCTSF